MALGKNHGGLPVKHWARDSVFYHIYPLGLCGAAPRNDFCAPVSPRLEQLYGWVDHLQNLGVNAVWLGPVFESTAHGYDTADYFRVDRRLGTNHTLSGVISALHEGGIRVILDAVTKPRRARFLGLSRCSGAQRALSLLRLVSGA